MKPLYEIPDLVFDERGYAWSLIGPFTVRYLKENIKPGWYWHIGDAFFALSLPRRTPYRTKESAISAANAHYRKTMASGLVRREGTDQGYEMSDDYRLLWELAQRQSVVCTVDVGNSSQRYLARSLVYPRDTDPPKPRQVVVSGNGKCFLWAYYIDNFLSQARALNLEWIVPNKDAEESDRVGRQLVARLSDEKTVALIRAERAEAAILRQVKNIEHWLDTGQPADAEESRSIYEQLCRAIGCEPDKKEKETKQC